MLFHFVCLCMFLLCLISYFGGIRMFQFTCIRLHCMLLLDMLPGDDMSTAVLHTPMLSLIDRLF